MPIFGHRTTGGRGTAISRSDNHDNQPAVSADDYNTRSFGATRRGPATQPAAPQDLGHHEGYSSAGGVNLPQEQYNYQGDPYTNTVANNNVPPIEHISDGQTSGTTTSLSGKVERVLGTLVCSQSLKFRGVQKERAAQARQAQSAELAEAERLEREAMTRRERAVAHGAHPANKALGGSSRAQEVGGNFGQPGANPTVGNPSNPMARGAAL